jgi:hypothetical protein
MNGTHSAPASWIDWAGWTFIGTVAQIVSLVAIAIAVAELVRRRRASPPVVWWLEIIGTYNLSGGQVAHVLNIHNAGTGAATLLNTIYVNSRVIERPGFLHQMTIGAGEKMTLLVTSKQIESAYLILSWTTHEDRNLVHVVWEPLASSAGLSRTWIESDDRVPKHRWYHGLRGRHPRPVGPLHYSRTEIRNSGDSETMRKRTRTVYDAALESAHEYHDVHSRQTKDLPYISQSFNK